MKYLIVDTANTFFRARHIAFRGANLDEKIGLSIHITMNSVNKVFRKFQADHVVFCLEGRSWRKDFYEPYKKNRIDVNIITVKDKGIRILKKNQCGVSFCRSK